jgi:hypothetical protein
MTFRGTGGIRELRAAWLAAALGMPLLALHAARAQDDTMPPETQAPAAPEQQAGQPETPAQANPRTRPALSQPAKPQDQADPSTVAVATPPPPAWPVNEQPAHASVVWDSHGLSIDAANSSLQQILKDVSTATGATIDGLSGDERVFGAYGPGQARDVLSQLLQGAGYNVMLIGDLGHGAPREILLSARRSGTDDAAQPKNSNNNDDDTADNDDDQPPPQQPPMRPGFPGGFPRSPQQRMEQMQRERQQLLQQQQQPQPQPNNTPQN